MIKSIRSRQLQPKTEAPKKNSAVLLKADLTIEPTQSFPQNLEICLMIQFIFISGWDF